MEHVQVVTEVRAAVTASRGTRDSFARPKILAICVAMGLVDVLLGLVARRYRLFLLFLELAPPTLVAGLGRLRAVRTADHAIRRVPAYKTFAGRRGVEASDVLDLSLPSTDKENYVRPFHVDARCVDGALPLVGTGIDESSGSTGTPFNWVRSTEERHASHVLISHFARYCYGDQPWITINAFSMGAWATGVNMGIALAANGMVKNTGPDAEKVLHTLEVFGPGHRYLVCGYPPFLKQLVDVARGRGVALESYRLMALLGGEGNSEGLRDYLSPFFDPIYSGYGATDIEIGLAAETPVSVAIRRAARSNGRLRAELFGTGSRLPMLFQYNPLSHYISADEQGELTFTTTRLNVLSPRIAYNVHDEGGVAPYAEIEARCRRAGVEMGDLPPPGTGKPLRLPFMWVSGRSDSTVSAMGANIYPEDVEQCLYDEPELARVTASYCLSLEATTDGLDRPYLSFEVSTAIDRRLRDDFDRRILRRMSALNNDFRVAMSEFAEAATPLIRLHPIGTGPFAGDRSRIKQVRMARPGALV
jgi:phenylacetate-CoA ligase